MHARGVERVFAACDAQKARSVQVGFRPQFGNLLQIAAVGEGAVFFAIGHDIFGYRRRDARNVAQKARAGGVHVNAHAVDHVFDYISQRTRKFGLVKVVLVLAHANRLRWNFYELGQRVLQAAAKAHRAAHGHVEVGVFLAGEFRCRIYRRAGLIHDGVA